MQYKKGKKLTILAILKKEFSGQRINTKTISVDKFPNVCS